MLFEITVSKQLEMKDVPKSCSECLFSDVCDLTIADLTKRGGMYFKAAATRGRAKNCPLKVVED